MRLFPPPSRFVLCLLASVAGCGGDGMPDPGPGAPSGMMPGGPGGGPSGNGLAVGPTGGTVDKLRFAFHGDTRPGNCNDTANYPSAIIENIFTREAARDVQFAVDLGDHMYVCNYTLATARAQMALYTAAAHKLGRTLFMTMGNHECGGGNLCPVGDVDPNFTAFSEALKEVSDKPYYHFDVATGSGIARFVVVADNAWEATQAQWLQDTLTKADTEAKYTIVTRHHPISNTQLQTQAEWQIIRAHKYTLFLTGHSHEYRHDTYDDQSGRTVVMGLGGAPPSPGTTFYGYGVVEQGDDDHLKVTIYDQQSDMVVDSWSVSPQ
jgi:hypothetical protein